MATRNGKESIMFPCHKEFLFFNFPVTQKKKKTENLTKFQREKIKQLKTLKEAKIIFTIQLFFSDFLQMMK